MLVPGERFVLDHLCGVVHNGPDLSTDLDLLQGHDHRTDGSISGLPLGKQMPKLQLYTSLIHNGGAVMWQVEVLQDATSFAD